MSDTGNLWFANDLFQNLFPLGEEGLFWWLDRRSRRWLYLGIPASALVLMLLYCICCRRRGRPRIPPTIDAREEKELCCLKPATFPEEKAFTAFCTAFDKDSNVAWLQVSRTCTTPQVCERIVWSPSVQTIRNVLVGMRRYSLREDVF